MVLNISFNEILISHRFVNVDNISFSLLWLYLTTFGHIMNMIYFPKISISEILNKYMQKYYAKINGDKNS